MGDPNDQFVVLLSRRIRCSADTLDRVMAKHIATHRDEDGDPRRVEEDDLARELSAALEQRVWISSWQNPAGMIEYAVELEGQTIDWEWLA